MSLYADGLKRCVGRGKEGRGEGGTVCWWTERGVLLCADGLKGGMFPYANGLKGRGVPVCGWTGRGWVPCSCVLMDWKRVGPVFLCADGLKKKEGGGGSL